MVFLSFYGWGLPVWSWAVIIAACLSSSLVKGLDCAVSIHPVLPFKEDVLPFGLV